MHAFDWKQTYMPPNGTLSQWLPAPTSSVPTRIMPVTDDKNKQACMPPNNVCPPMGPCSHLVRLHPDHGRLLYDVERRMQVLRTLLLGQLRSAGSAGWSQSELTAVEWVPGV